MSFGTRDAPPMRQTAALIPPALTPETVLRVRDGDVAAALWHEAEAFAGSAGEKHLQAACHAWEQRSHLDVRALRAAVNEMLILDQVEAIPADIRAAGLLRAARLLVLFGPVIKGGEKLPAAVVTAAEQRALEAGDAELAAAAGSLAGVLEAVAEATAPAATE